MKILVKGNITARKHIISLMASDFRDIHAGMQMVGEDTDYDMVIEGNLEVDSFMINGAELYVTGSVICLGL